jgi:hypothetical protein
MATVYLSTMDSPLLDYCRENPRPYTYFAIGSAPHTDIHNLTPAWDQIVPVFLKEVSGSKRAIHYDPWFKLPWLMEYFKDAEFSEFADGWRFVSADLEVLIFPKEFKHCGQYSERRDDWIVEGLISQSLEEKTLFVLQEYTGQEIASWFQKLYEASTYKGLFKSKILFDMTYGDDAGCMTDLTKYRPYYTGRGDFINLTLMTGDEMQKVIGVDPGVDAHIVKFYRSKCIALVEFHFVNYRRRVKGEPLLNHCMWYGTDARPEEIMGVLHSKFAELAPVLQRLGFLTPYKKSELEGLLTKYYLIDMYEWAPTFKRMLG